MLLDVGVQVLIGFYEVKFPFFLVDENHVGKRLVLLLVAHLLQQIAFSDPSLACQDDNRILPEILFYLVQVVLPNDIVHDFFFYRRNFLQK